MRQIEIVYLNEKNSAGFYDLAAEYLPGSSMKKMRERSELFLEAFIALEHEGDVIGVCYGWARKLDVREDRSFVLDGIAIKSDFQKNGYGKILLDAFEKVVSGYGYYLISVGSAGGYVEKFYIDCGFIPKEYKVWQGESPKVEKTFENTTDYFLYERKNSDGFVVMEKRVTPLFRSYART